MGDVDPVRELPYGPRSPGAAPEAGQMAASDYGQPSKTACVLRGVHRWIADRPQLSPMTLKPPQNDRLRREHVGLPRRAWCPRRLPRAPTATGPPISCQRRYGGCPGQAFERLLSLTVRSSCSPSRTFREPRFSSSHLEYSSAGPSKRTSLKRFLRSSEQTASTQAAAEHRFSSHQMSAPRMREMWR